MTAQILDGKAISAEIRKELISLAKVRDETDGSQPGLAIIQAGSDASSNVYVNRLRRTAEEIGIRTSHTILDAATTNENLKQIIIAMNADPSIQGILVQMPLPEHLSQKIVAETILPSKDVDGISARSAGNLFLGLPTFVPSTCAAVIEILERSGISVAGRRAVVVGASNVVGKPLSFMLLQRNATVSTCHKYTENLAGFTREAEILVVAAGYSKLIKADMVRPGAVVIDVGINVQTDGTIVGDVDFEAVKEIASAITPVPGGVGPLTNLMVLKQTITGEK